RLHVELAAVQADRRTQQLLQDGDDLRFAHQRLEEGIALEDHRLQPPHPRQRRGVGGFEIVELVVFGHAARLGDDAVGKRAQLGKLLALDQARDHQIAVAPVIVDLLLGQHAESIARGAAFTDNHAMAIRALFPTLLYHSTLAKTAVARFNRTLLDECQALAASDAAGQRWSAKHYLGGYTSYGSLD